MVNDLCPPDESYPVEINKFVRFIEDYSPDWNEAHRSFLSSVPDNWVPGSLTNLHGVVSEILVRQAVECASASIPDIQIEFPELPIPGNGNSLKQVELSRTVVRTDDGIDLAEIDLLFFCLSKYVVLGEVKLGIRSSLHHRWFKRSMKEDHLDRRAQLIGSFLGINPDSVMHLLIVYPEVATVPSGNIDTFRNNGGIICPFFYSQEEYDSLLLKFALRYQIPV